MSAWTVARYAAPSALVAKVRGAVWRRPAGRSSGPATGRTGAGGRCRTRGPSCACVRPLEHRLHPGRWDEFAQVGPGDADVAAGLMEGDTPLGDKAAHEAGAGAELVGGLVDGEQSQRRGSLSG